MTVKKLANKRPELTDIEIEDNGGKDLSAYDLKVGRKNTAVDAFGNLTTDKSAVSSGNDISINDLIDFVNSYSEDSIQIDGKNKAVRNSAGQRIARTEEGLRALYDWFGDRKVVDENGRPLVVYHGSPNKGIQIFDKNRIGNRDNGFFGKGFYFTPKYYVAEGYANTNDIYPDFNDQDNKGEVYPVYLDIKNPKYVRDIDEGTIDTEELKQQGYDGIIVYSFEEYPESVRENDPYVKETIEEAKGYKNTWWQLKNYNDEVVGRKYIDEVIVFEPNQIKSVDNRGSFSRTTNGHQNSLQFHVLFINIHQTIHNIHYATKVSDVKMGVHSIDI